MFPSYLPRIRPEPSADEGVRHRLHQFRSLRFQKTVGDDERADGVAQVAAAGGDGLIDRGIQLASVVAVRRGFRRQDAAPDWLAGLICSSFVLQESSNHSRRSSCRFPKLRKRTWIASLNERLLPLRPDPADFLDLKRRPAGFLGDFAVLLVNERARRLVAVQPAKKLGGHPPVGALGAVFIEDVEEGEFAFGIGPGFFRHARLFPDHDAAVKTNWCGISRLFSAN
jgi:hypothetical protein